MSEQYVGSEEEVNSVFFSALGRLSPSYVLDIGTRDGRTAIAMKNASPPSRVIAFEANPENYFDLCLSDRVKSAGVWVNHLAISDVVGSVNIHIPHYATRSSGKNRGVASLKKRNENNMVYQSYRVPSTTLDDFFKSEVDRNPTFGLWVDVEGALFEVLTGAKETLTRTLFLKAEVEGYPYWEGQKLDSDVIRLLLDLGFTLVGTSNKGKSQYDVVFANFAEFPEARDAWSASLPSNSDQNSNV